MGKTRWIIHSASQQWKKERYIGNYIFMENICEYFFLSVARVLAPLCYFLRLINILTCNLYINCVCCCCFSRVFLRRYYYILGVFFFSFFNSSPSSSRYIYCVNIEFSWYFFFFICSSYTSLPRHSLHHSTTIYLIALLSLYLIFTICIMPPTLKL